jgi:hypothetical protein
MVRLLRTLAALMMSVSAFACFHLNEAIVTEVNADNQTVVVTKNDKSHTFTAASKTEVLIDGKVAKLSEIKSGDKVSVDYESANDVVKISVTRQS